MTLIFKLCVFKLQWFVPLHRASLRRRSTRLDVLFSFLVDGEQTSAPRDIKVHYIGLMLQLCAGKKRFGVGWPRPSVGRCPADWLPKSKNLHGGMWSHGAVRNLIVANFFWYGSVIAYPISGLGDGQPRLTTKRLDPKSRSVCYARLTLASTKKGGKRSK